MSSEEKNMSTNEQLVKISTTLDYIAKGSENVQSELRSFKNEMKQEIKELRNKFVSRSEFEPVKQDVENQQEEIQTLKEEQTKMKVQIMIGASIGVVVLQQVVSWALNALGI